MSIVLIDVVPSQVGSWGLYHEGTILQNHIQLCGRTRIYYNCHVLVS